MSNERQFSWSCVYVLYLYNILSLKYTANAGILKSMRTITFGSLFLSGLCAKARCQVTCHLLVSVRLKRITSKYSLYRGAASNRLSEARTEWLGAQIWSETPEFAEWSRAMVGSEVFWRRIKDEREVKVYSRGLVGAKQEPRERAPCPSQNPFIDPSVSICNAPKLRAVHFHMLRVSVWTQRL